jgi:hypothetical protein
MAKKYQLCEDPNKEVFIQASLKQNKNISKMRGLKEFIMYNNHHIF